MISYVWTCKQPFWAGRGGSENYTAGHIRELNRRGIPARLITVGLGENDGRDDFTDIAFTSLDSKEQLSELDDTLIGVSYPINVPTKRQPYTILHIPLRSSLGNDPLFRSEGIETNRLMAPSNFAAKMWRSTLGMHAGKITAVHPFAEEVFARVKRPQPKTDKIRILFAGRLMPDKGIFTLLAALHLQEMEGVSYELTATTAADNTNSGPIIRKLLEAHPWINVVPARRNPKEMAELMAEHDIVLMPSSNIFWKETFGIVSVEAQHAGCRVVGSNSGGIPETDCGGLLLVRPDDPQALARGIVKAAALGPLTEAERLYASSKFTVGASVDRLLNVIRTTEVKRKPLLHKQGALVREQLDLAFGTISELGLRFARENKLR
ncbi:MAG TPA: glycosyltransferase family 4 protein [Candidatus Saccharimonadales bacterium]|nr:glycosyltransferase family 4 protein [Candidatus Saccharimonadales bacterium]